MPQQDGAMPHEHRSARPLDLDNSHDLTETEMGALNGEFARAWLDWCVRAPKDVPDRKIARNLVHFVTRRYFGEWASDLAG